MDCIVQTSQTHIVDEKSIKHRFFELPTLLISNVFTAISLYTWENERGADVVSNLCIQPTKRIIE